MITLINYKCPRCGACEADVWSDEDAPKCCDLDMHRSLKMNAPGVTFKLFRPYTVGTQLVTSKQEERAAIGATLRPGETVKDRVMVKDSAYSRKVQCEELRHTLVKQYSSNSPQIARHWHNKPMPEFTD